MVYWLVDHTDRRWSSDPLYFYRPDIQIRSTHRKSAFLYNKSTLSSLSVNLVLTHLRTHRVTEETEEWRPSFLNFQHLSFTGNCLPLSEGRRWTEQETWYLPPPPPMGIKSERQRHLHLGETNSSRLEMKVKESSAYFCSTDLLAGLFSPVLICWLVYYT